MDELVAKTKVLTVYKKCETCGNGYMNLVKHANIILTDPPKYLHRCSECGAQEYFVERFPSLRYVTTESPREPKENELKTGVIEI